MAAARALPASGPAPIDVLAHKLMLHLDVFFNGTKRAVARLAEAVARLTTEIKRMASQIEQWAQRHETDLAEIKGTLDGVAQGVRDLDALVTQLQNSPDRVTPADQAILDRIQAASQALVARAKEIQVDATDGQQPAPTPTPGTPPA